MTSKSVWTADAAAGNLVRVLKQARESGPQEIQDETGVYVLKAVGKNSKDDVASSLLKLRPKQKP
ncbi:hypothetical protein FZ934_20205 (plasmid) [Rhizobium grahamii]|uniref:Uncharacterized protein n=1 Tax=Rhizobium grahamii TaxID=1120045 RepID=A0A5Q0CBI6_9HYPH|nr:hypothetical protein FZ934_20205 [Rhizobium grahamii]QRM52551.1 hypothetical protein F3Y33_25455 [Rhizobium sp. BG6]